MAAGEQICGIDFSQVIYPAGGTRSNVGTSLCSSVEKCNPDARHPWLFSDAASAALSCFGSGSLLVEVLPWIEAGQIRLVAVNASADTAPPADDTSSGKFDVGCPRHR